MTNIKNILLIFRGAIKGKLRYMFLGIVLAVVIQRAIARAFVTGKFTDFPVCVIRYIFIRKLSHLTISSPFILINQKMHKKKNHSGF